MWGERKRNRGRKRRQREGELGGLTEVDGVMGESEQCGGGGGRLAALMP